MKIAEIAKGYFNYKSRSATRRTVSATAEIAEGYFSYKSRSATRRTVSATDEVIASLQ